MGHPPVEASEWPTIRSERAQAWVWCFNMTGMATYIAGDDTYAGFASIGRYFGYFGLAAGAIGITGWAAIHGHIPGLKTADTLDQFFLAAMEWIGIGLSVILAAATLGSLNLSSKSRGTVTIGDLGVTRQIGERIRMLRWQEIEGYVAVAGGIALIPRGRSQMIEIPRFLDDYTACIAEIEARGVGRLPPSRLRCG